MTGTYTVQCMHLQNKSRLVIPIATHQKASRCLIRLRVRPPDVEEPIIEG